MGCLRAGGLRAPCTRCLPARVLQREEYHTHLAMLYLDEVLQQKPGANATGAAVTETRAKLRHLLQKSDSYRVHFLLGEWVSAASGGGDAGTEALASCLDLGGGVVLESLWHRVSLLEGR